MSTERSEPDLSDAWARGSLSHRLADADERASGPRGLLDPLTSYETYSANSMGITSVVVGIDGTEPSDRALLFSIGLALRECAYVSACFVAHQPNTFGVAVPPVDYRSYAKELAQRVDEELERTEVSGSFFYREGDVADELKRLADEQVADLITVGRSRHPHLHVGAVPRRLLDVSGHAVLIVP